MKENNKNLHLGIKGSSLSHLKISAANSILSSVRVRDSILAVNELSTGLSVGMTNPDFLNSYQGVIKTQVKALNNSLILGESTKLGAIKMYDLIDASIAPISSVIADIGLASINANKLYELGSIGKSALVSTQKISDLCLDVVQRQQSVLVSNIQKIQDFGISHLVSDSMASTQVISSGINSVLRSLPTYPTEIKFPNLETIYELGEITEKELSEHQEKLDKALLKIKPSLVEYRKGCWQTFRKKGRDYIGQSSSSMRRLVDDLLRILAPEEKVMETDFFKNSPIARDTKGKPTKKARVYHIVNFDKKQTEHLKRLAKGFLEAYDNLSTWDHKPLQHVLHPFI